MKKVKILLGVFISIIVGIALFSADNNTQSLIDQYNYHVNLTNADLQENTNLANLWIATQTIETRLEITEKYTRVTDYHNMHIDNFYDFMIVNEKSLVKVIGAKQIFDTKTQIKDNRVLYQQKVKAMYDWVQAQQQLTQQQQEQKSALLNLLLSLL